MHQLNIELNPFIIIRICEECKFAAESDSRYEAHLKEPRHVNYYRNLAYMQPKKRQVSDG